MQHGYDFKHITNMDETQMSFDLPPSRTVYNTGEKAVSTCIETRGHEKEIFTVVFACRADGTKLKPMVIFKGKKPPKAVILAGIALHVNPKG